jgi:hypothetical protein
MAFLAEAIDPKGRIDPQRDVERVRRAVGRALHSEGLL